MTERAKYTWQAEALEWADKQWAFGQPMSNISRRIAELRALAEQQPEAVEPVGVVPKAGHCILHIPQSTPCALAGYCLNANPQASAPAAHNQDLGVHHAAPDAPADDLNALVAQIVEESRSDWQRARIEIIAQAITDLRAEVERAKAQRDEAWQAFTRLRRAYSMVRYPTLTEELRLLYDAADAVAAGKSEGKA